MTLNLNQKCMLGALMLLTVFHVPLMAQTSTSIQIRGRIVEQNENKPLPGVNVFLAGSTLGSASLNDGSFSFSVPSGMLSYEITVSMVGFNTETRVFAEPDLKDELIIFRLEPATYLLDEITITDSNEEWLKNVARLRRLVFSTTDNSSACSIINPERLSIAYDSADNEISATSKEPFTFRNEALGYVVELHQPKFFGSTTTVKWEGILHFEEMVPTSSAEEKRWNANRRNAYLGSARQFLVALSKGTTNDDGFFVATTDKPGFSIEHRVAPNPKDYVSVQVADPTIPTWRIHFPKTLSISYQREPESRAYRAYQDEMGLRQRDELELRTGRLRERKTQNSWLSLSGDYAVIDQFGNEYGAYLLKRFGYWEWERLCEILPSDYSLN